MESVARQLAYNPRPSCLRRRNRGGARPTLRVLNGGGGQSLTHEERRQPTLVESHLLFARKLARGFYLRRTHLGFAYEEFESAAFLGLCEAAQRFDSTKGVSFQSYSYTRINGAMFDLLRSAGDISKGAFARDGDTTILELAMSVRRNARDLSSYVNTFDDFQATALHCRDRDRIELVYRDQESVEITVTRRDFSVKLRALLRYLPKGEREVLELHYFQGLQFNEIAQRMESASKTKVCRLHQSGLASLKGIIKRRCFA